MEAWKEDLFKKAFRYGIIKDPQWQHSLDDAVPLWVILEMFVEVLEKIDPPYYSYD
jgi:hypothetical protein